MITRKTLISNIFIGLLAFLPQPSLADGFTSADVLEWSEKQQDGYFQSSVTMIGIVATQVEGKEHIARCIDAWHGGGNDSQSARSAQIREVMKGLSNYHPQAVILAVVEKECGDF
ncbi:hypothetical protein [Shimia sp. R9_3]|uniref:hypothetical protein n=1 Tax=Shimia sp. R9_3 TaxID=2821113 RepID=UPI001ADAFA92|nr:hypothetical protein [Shimia sp. R9_3]MBO9401424.1 hypothetical protein [Shimia sp. R9_3]